MRFFTKVSDAIERVFGKRVIEPVFARNPAQEWVLAASAIYTYSNQAALIREPRLFTSLHESFRTQRDRDQIQRELSELWNITGVVSAQQQLEGLLNDGHQAEYEGLKELAEEVEFSKKSERQKKHILREVMEEQKREAQEQLDAMGEPLATRMEPEVLEEEVVYFLKKAHFIEAHAIELEKQGIVAWDLVRIGRLVKDCYIAGYLSAEQAWQYLFQAAYLLQDTFSSWKEASENFLLGMEYWLQTDSALASSSTNLSKELSDFRRRHAFLLEAEVSPWRLLPWNLRLSEA